MGRKTAPGRRFRPGLAAAFVSFERRAIDVADPDLALADLAGEAEAPAAAKAPECLHRSSHSAGSPETFAR
jgi:hypothetical protein